MKEEVLKLGNIPSEYKFKNSKIIKRFKEI